MATFLSYPIVLIHGYVDVPAISGTWRVAEKVLNDMGIEFLTPHIPPHGSIDERSKSLIQQISKAFPGRTVHLFGHSMGGINARDIASIAMSRDLGFKIHTVTTFGTPHRGVKMINFASPTRDHYGAFSNLTHNFMAKFNERVQNNPSVQYFSWSSITQHPTLVFLPVFPASRLFGPTDGVVNSSSSVWGEDLGKGTHLATIEGLDHIGVTGRTAVTATIPHLVAAEKGTTVKVQVVDNNLVQAVARGVEANVDKALSPARSLFAVAGLTKLDGISEFKL
ncbi:alpha/beta-hydrolase [Coprinopsis marcescibilis]|uniref:Alpha/beta-hydrolase n=1 Tax=Coprinopsis marcescibilis TaxID=230819 RepID=A0A5C3KRG8_COPMA|nr:alpha/beta-hydrolase [Coprinopsis marcescibilis]